MLQQQITNYFITVITVMYLMVFENDCQMNIIINQVLRSIHLCGQGNENFAGLSISNEQRWMQEEEDSAG